MSRGRGRGLMPNMLAFATLSNNINIIELIIIIIDPFFIAFWYLGYYNSSYMIELEL